jgi:hypothetical protein
VEVAGDKVPFTGIFHKVWVGWHQQGIETMNIHASMNRIYRLIWSEVRSAWVLDAEAARRHGKSGGARSKVSRSILAAAISLALTPISNPAGAAIVTPGTSVTVTKSYAYTAFDGGDFVFSTSGAAPGCASGWWISASDAGFKSAVATVLAAQVAGSFIVVYGDTASLWLGSPSGQYCHVHTVGITS